MVIPTHTPTPDMLIHEFIYAAAIKNSNNECAIKWNKAKIINLWKIRQVTFPIYACSIYFIQFQVKVMLWSSQYCVYKVYSLNILNFLFNYYPSLIKFSTTQNGEQIRLRQTNKMENMKKLWFLFAFYVDIFLFVFFSNTLCIKKPTLK